MNQNPQNFVHLHVHSEYSLLESACRIKELVRQVKASGQKAVAVTDSGNLYGAVVFYQEAVKAGIKPIIGCELQIADKNQKLVLLCENQQGYQNLIKLVSAEQVTFSLVKKYHAGLICLSVTDAGTIPELLLEGNFSYAEQNVLQWKNLFSAEHYFLEIQNHHLPKEKQLLPLLVKLSGNTGVPLVAVNQVRYLKRADAQTQKILTCIKNNQSLEELSYSGKEAYLKSSEEMMQIFSALPDAVQNTVRIAERCNLEIQFHEQKLPHFVQDGITDNKAYFEKLCQQGMYRHYGQNPPPEVRQRLQYEMQVIEDMGFTDYFLIVQDFIRYARNQEIPVGTGRGSASGSLCSYCLDITGIDPVKEDLLFERFLNPERRSMPDIDIDFCIEGRAKVRDYVIRRYGKEHVAEIVAFDTLKARASVRDTGRILHLPNGVIATAVKYLDSRMTITESLEQSPELKQLCEQNQQIYQLLETASRIEGFPRHTTIHAAGVVITDKPVMEYVPIFRDEQMLVTQYTMTALEELGLLKMDFLGLRNLTVIRDTERAVRQYVPGFSAGSLQTDDKAVYTLISQGNTSGVFQLESTGMKKFLTRLKPGCMDDIMTALAIYRPGPMDSIPDYLRNRQNPQRITYLHPALKDILKPTYGCILYQEQVMQICRKLAGFSYAEADNVRYAMSKKKTALMQEEKKKFLDGCQNNQIPLRTAEQIFSQMESFAEYAFNKSHAAAYARIAYQTAYLKTHYFGEYMASLMTSVISETEKLASYLEECRSAGMKIYPPDINRSGWNFIFKNGNLYFGLLAVKGLGRGLIDKMLAERRKNGAFTSFSDFCKRMTPLGLYKKTLESMIQAGALDNLDYNRKQMLTYYEQMLEPGNYQTVIDGQMSLFGETESAQSLILPDMPDFSAVEKLQMEKFSCGMYLSGHPLDSFSWIKQLLHCTDISTLEQLPEHAPAKLICMIQACRKFRTKTNAEMCFLRLEDKSGITEAVVFPELYASVREALENGRILYLTGKISRKNQHLSIICDSIQEQQNFSAMLGKMLLCLKVTHSPEDLQNLKKLSELCRNYPGRTGVVLYFTDTRNYAYPKQKIYISLSEDCIQAVHRIFPPEKIGCIAKIM
ncbi:MAG: DNA polymerase III subunit alpha [Ruminococcus sp.]|nr:DNA polymerase III subunit alpha [Ruminococcus sp.]